MRLSKVLMFRVTDEMFDDLIAVQQKTGSTMSQILRKAVETYLEIEGLIPKKRITIHAAQRRARELRYNKLIFQDICQTFEETFDERLLRLIVQIASEHVYLELPPLAKQMARQLGIQLPFDQQADEQVAEEFEYPETL